MISFWLKVASFLSLASLIIPVQSHQTIAYPFPFSKYSKCSRNKNCETPCPSTYHRGDVNPNNPAIIVSRGDTFEIRINRNNHDYGFSRYALVSLEDRYDWDKHEQGAFLYMCNDVNEAACEAWNWNRDCYFDRSGHYYRHIIRAPSHAPDGVYVLGWAWFGGNFEDFFDCTYIEIRGGTLSRSHTPYFDASNSKTAEDGKCSATSKEVGTCTYDKCKRRGGSIPLGLGTPSVFDGSGPQRIRQSFLTPYIRPRPTVVVKGIAIVDADDPSDVKYWSGDYVEGISEANICLKGFKPAITCVTEGDVAYTHFFKDGWTYEYDSEAPFDMENSDFERGRFQKLDFDYTNTHFSVGCMAKGTDESESWKTISVSTMFDDRSC
ncbi:hypothetical protein FGB62_101g05 [Gracilaria domingensis]|nr:hypothetical protein FGB62_101g05 [Gracilaria domingensis]